MGTAHGGSETGDEPVLAPAARPCTVEGERSGGSRVMGAVRRGCRRGAKHVLALAMVLLGCAGAGAQGGGMFRFGHVSWEAEGNEVMFTIETAFRKSISKPEWQNAKVGDELVLIGKEPPQFLYGDSQFASTLKMGVTAISQTQDWIMGVVKLKHVYATPNNQQRPWRAQYVGCCRVSDLKNNAELGFEITAEVDLTTARSSPRAATLPIISVPLQAENALGGLQNPSAYIPSRSGSDVDWDVGTPIDVGSVAGLSSAKKSFLHLPLGPLDSRNGSSCAQSSVGARCLVQMLSADPSVGGGAAAMTVEGWVRLASSAGGYIVSTNHSCASGNRVSTLSIVANQSHITVGHEQDDGITLHIPFEARQEDGTLRNLTGRWFHLAVVRMHESRPVPSEPSTICSDAAGTAGVKRTRCLRQGTSCECPICVSGERGKDTISYRVYLDGIELSQVGVDLAYVTVMCGPSCGNTPKSQNTRVSSDGGASLLFGAYFGVNGGNGIFLDGWLDEWRVWNGARSQIQIQNLRTVMLSPGREPFLGDPTEGNVDKDNYKYFSTLLATYSMDYSCPIDVAAPCAMVAVLPVYPKGSGVYGRPGADLNTPYKLLASGGVTTAPPDSQGVMMYKTAVDERLGVDADGRVTFVPDQGPGDYQVTVLLANADGSAKVPVDFIVRVLSTTYYHEGNKAYALCNIVGFSSGSAGETGSGSGSSGNSSSNHVICPGKTNSDYCDCASKCTATDVDSCNCLEARGPSCCDGGEACGNNKWVPRLQILGAVVTNGFCSGNLSRETPLTPYGDLTFLTFPCSVNTWSGFEMRLDARGQDFDSSATNQVGFVIGPKPAGMSTRMRRSDSSGELALAWTPCDADIGSHVVCLSANDYQNDTSSAASEQKCVKIQVLEDPAPYFDLRAGKTQNATVIARMGRETVVEVYVIDDNCLDEIAISNERLPPGAQLQANAPPRVDCTFAHSTMRWIPPFDFGGWDEDMCFTAADKPCEACGLPATLVQHCVRVRVERCVYAIQPDQQLQEVAAFYEASWMQIWSLNQDLRHPDIVMWTNQTIRVGHKYRAGPQESTGGVAKRMGMTMQQLLLLNRDLRRPLSRQRAEIEIDAPLRPHQELCLMPDSCRGMARTHISRIKYEDAETLAEHSSDAIPLPAQPVNQHPDASSLHAQSP